MSDYKLLTTQKKEGQTKAAVRQAAASQYPDYRVAKVEDKGDSWEVRLDKQPDKVSSRTRQAAPPPEFLKEKDDSGSSADSDSSDTDDSAESDSDSSDSDSGDSDSKGDEKGDKDPDPSKSKDPVEAINGVISDLKSLLDQLGGHATELKDKADKVDEIHELTKGDVAPVDDVSAMGDVPPVPPLDPAAVGPVPGGPPVPPRKPPVPRKPGLRGGAPLPTTFTKRQTHFVEHPIKDDEGEYSLGDFLAAIASHPNLTDYEVAETRTAADANVYVAKLTLKN
jgi:hypothetical protein